MPTRAAEAFFDTSVLLYLVSADTRKADTAESLLAQGGHVSVQVLDEFASAARRKAAMSWDDIRNVLGTVRQVCEVQALTVATHERALELAARHRLGFYDASIVAAALGAGCATLYSEDLQEGREFARRLEVRNPFRS